MQAFDVQESASIGEETCSPQKKSGMLHDDL